LDAPFGVTAGGEVAVPLPARFSVAEVEGVVGVEAVTDETPPPRAATSLSEGAEGTCAGAVDLSPETLGASTFTGGVLLGVVLPGTTGVFAGDGVLVEMVGVGAGTDVRVVGGVFTGTVGVTTVTVGPLTVTEGTSTGSDGNPMEAADETPHTAMSSPMRRARHVPVRALRNFDKRAIRNSPRTSVQRA
jgi:hypothetical protein